jgi:hypothetical protein
MDLDEFTPLIVCNRAQIAARLAERRRELGETCEDTDDRAGFSDRYVTKLENGTRQGIHITPMAEVWLEAMGLKLVLMGARMAEAIGAVRAVDPAPRNHWRDVRRAAEAGAGVVA